MSGPQGKQAAWAIKLDPLRCSRSCPFWFWSVPSWVVPNNQAPPQLPGSFGSTYLRKLLRFGVILQIWVTLWLEKLDDACDPLLVISMILSDAYLTESVPYWAVATIRLSKCHLPELTTQSFLFGHLSISLGFPLHWKLQHYLRFLLRLCTLVLSQRRGAF